MEDSILAFLLPRLNHWGYFVLLLMTFLETSAFLGLLVPGEAVVVIAGLFASRGLLDLGDVIWVASVGAIMGDTIGYLIGHRFGEGFFHRYARYFFLKKDHLDEVKASFTKHGGMAVFLGRFVSWLRAFAPVVAGVSRMPYPKFLLFNIFGGVTWAITLSLVGYFVGHSWEIIQEYLNRVGLFASTSAVLALYSYFLFTKKKRFIQEKVGWIDKKLSAQIPKTWDFMKDRFRAGRWYGLNLTTSLFCLIFAVLAFGEIVEDLIDRETLFYLDFRIQRLAEGIISPGQTQFMAFVSDFGDDYILIAVIGIGIWLLHKRHGWDLFALFLAGGVGKVLQVFLKSLFHRSRPTPQLVEAYGYSFPSGHAFSAVIVYGFLIYIIWKFIKSRAVRFALISALVLLVVLVGVSRVYLNVHWLTDVLAGFAAGFGWLVFSIMIAGTMREMVAKK